MNLVFFGAFFILSQSDICIINVDAGHHGVGTLFHLVFTGTTNLRESLLQSLLSPLGATRSHTLKLLLRDSSKALIALRLIPLDRCGLFINLMLLY